jgi:hypothetical protein
MENYSVFAACLEMRLSDMYSRPEQVVGAACAGLGAHCSLYLRLLFVRGRQIASGLLSRLEPLAGKTKVWVLKEEAAELHDDTVRSR